MEAISTGISQDERKILYAALKKVGFAAKAATPPLPSQTTKTTEIV
jgi:hypothetical protein